jgi:HEAT repeat protein
VAALIGLLKEPGSDKTEIIRLLGEFKDDRAIKPLADALRVNTLRLAAVDALKNFGPKAEDEVILVLDDRRFYAKQSACEVLKAIGTRKSLAPLEAVSKDRNRTTARIAQDALEAVRARNP